MAGVLTSTNGSLTYLTLAYVLANKFDDAAVQNAAGKFVAPWDLEHLAAAATLKSVPSDNNISIVDPPASASGAYPISTFTYAIVPTKSPKAKELKAFISWAVGPTGQSFGPKLEFAPLPAKVVSAAKSTLNKDQPSGRLRAATRPKDRARDIWGRPSPGSWRANRVTTSSDRFDKTNLMSVSAEPPPHGALFAGHEKLSDRLGDPLLAW